MCLLKRHCLIINQVKILFFFFFHQYHQNHKPLDGRSSFCFFRADVDLNSHAHGRPLAVQEGNSCPLLASNQLAESAAVRRSRIIYKKDCNQQTQHQKLHHFKTINQLKQHS